MIARAILVVLGLQGASTLVAQTAPGPPPISAHPGDKSLTVAWSEPASSPGITAYDVRHITTAADETVDANWTVIDNAWTSGGLYEVITGLTNDTEYDVQVRAVASSVEGAWSTAAEKVTPTDSTFDPSVQDISGLGTLPGPGLAIGGVLDSTSDTDGYLLVLRRATMLRVASSGIPGSVGTLYVVSEVGAEGFYRYNMQADAPTAVAGQELAVNEALPAGRYLIQVTPPSSLATAKKYELQWSAEPRSKDLALSLALDDSAEGVIGERGKSNWYTINLTEETDLLIWSYPGLFRYFGESQAVLNLKATLYESDGSVAQSSSLTAMPGARSYETRERGHFAIRKKLPSGT